MKLIMTKAVTSENDDNDETENKTGDNGKVEVSDRMLSNDGNDVGDGSDGNNDDDVDDNDNDDDHRH